MLEKSLDAEAGDLGNDELLSATPPAMPAVDLATAGVVDDFEVLAEADASGEGDKEV